MTNNINNIDNINKRILHLSKEIDNESIGDIINNLIKIINEDDINDSKLKDYKREPIHIYIQSFGGSVYDMFALIDIILTSKTPIYTYCLYAMSAGSMIFMAGHKRFVYENSIIMIHQMYCGWYNKYLDTKIEQKENDRLQNAINNYILKQTKIPEDKFYKKFNSKEDWYIDAKKALKFNIATDLIERK